MLNNLTHPYCRVQQLLVYEIFPVGISDSTRPIRQFDLQSHRVAESPETAEGNDHFRIARYPP
jgi:hypothetical protein